MRLAFLLLVACAPAMAEPLVACPALLQVGRSVAQFETADVFVGPPEHRASLLPDLETAEWRLELAHVHRESLYLVCRYRDSNSTITIPIPPSATYCRFGGGPHKNVAECGIEQRRHQPKGGRHGHQSQNPDQQTQ